MLLCEKKRVGKVFRHRSHTQEANLSAILNIYFLARVPSRHTRKLHLARNFALLLKNSSHILYVFAPHKCAAAEADCNGLYVVKPPDKKRRTTLPFFSHSTLSLFSLPLPSLCQAFCGLFQLFLCLGLPTTTSGSHDDGAAAAPGTRRDVSSWRAGPHGRAPPRHDEQPGHGPHGAAAASDGSHGTDGRHGRHERRHGPDGWPDGPDE